ncbi:hypothetical protein AB0869_15515 [Micromonospora vinacea]|uniref:hypothetical protein n=1 Tax=Micromonospora vinacea TaxID=709878 RepID=UPI00345722FA
MPEVAEGSIALGEANRVTVYPHEDAGHLTMGLEDAPQAVSHLSGVNAGVKVRHPQVTGHVLV